jgi:hypothetical protein
MPTAIAVGYQNTSRVIFPALALSLVFSALSTGMTGAVMLIALWGFAFGAFPACASI